MSSNDGYIYENRDWVFFGIGEDWEEDRCPKCYGMLRKELKPNKYCINCWKLEIFYSNCTDLEAVKRFLIDESKRDHSFHGKWLKREMPLPVEAYTSIPASGHPDADVERDGVILIYTRSIEERDRLKERILKGLQERGLYKKSSLSYRRGCLDFDELIGNWKEWYELDKDYPE